MPCPAGHGGTMVGPWGIFLGCPVQLWIPMDPYGYQWITWKTSVEVPDF